MDKAEVGAKIYTERNIEIIKSRYYLDIDHIMLGSVTIVIPHIRAEK